MQNEILNCERPKIEASRSRGYVLVVDDEEPNRTLLRDPLEAQGYEVAEAVNGQQALDSIAERAPDVILLDVMMPLMDGFEVCRRLKTNEETAAIPILMVTALSDRKERLMGIKAGANDFLNKPVDIQDVTLRVGNAAYTKSLFDQLSVEREKSERLLLNILPKSVAEQMKQGDVNIADSHADVTVLLADLVGFTTLTTHVGAEQVVCMLNEIFSAFDVLVGKRRLEKIKTIGDAYMVAGGLPGPREDHAEAMAELALELRKEVAQFNHRYDTSIRLRIGMATGPVIAGVIGRNKFSYDLWGDTVNLACQLESAGDPDNILVSESTRERLRSKYCLTLKNGVEVKGRGRVAAYILGDRL
ncbi:MAG: response regulator [Verrucomicrobia bacterium]|nr:response regulator [Verrucomicrobiota bacterium]